MKKNRILKSDQEDEKIQYNLEKRKENMKNEYKNSQQTLHNFFQEMNEKYNYSKLPRE